MYTMEVKMEKGRKEEELFIPKTKHKGLKITLAILLILGLGFCGYYLYQEKFCNPNKTVSNIMSNMEKAINQTLDVTNNGKYKINGLVKIDANLSDNLKNITDLVKNLDVQFNGEIDTENKLGKVTLNTKYKNEQLTGLKVYYENNTLHILLDELYDKYLKLSRDTVNDNTNLSIPEITIDNKDIKTITIALMTAYKKQLANLDFKRLGTTITINETTHNVYNNYVVLNSTEVKKLLQDIINTLSQNKDFIEVYKKIYGDIPFNTTMNSYLDKLDTTNTYKINYYTTKDILNPRFISFRIEINNNDNKSTYNFDKVNDDEFLITVNGNNISISSIIKKTNSILNINLNANIMKKSIKLELNTNYEKIKEISKEDVSNSKDIKDLDEEEINEIKEKIKNNNNLESFIQDATQALKTVK